jgi:hypothetical protein
MPALNSKDKGKQCYHIDVEADIYGEQLNGSYLVLGTAREMLLIFFFLITFFLCLPASPAKLPPRAH